MQTIKISSKRQATLPVELCRQMNLKQGDRLHVYPEKKKGKIVWRLSPIPPDEPRWFASLRPEVSGAQRDHSMSEIRKSIARRRSQ
ncbi:AbrB/MazE/SpoVT family DNA-binding domain-containing protein [Kamptonema cortianum]|nr:AbrB/MazE/SpoVT family DNA-binding domain-containing protein [Kamptonema cortianum]MDL5047177.1 AbrB/MazE/SpoVT family DNA-binding domain-containing protein [Oscillatoria amoena NRMC-F 0135]